MTCSQTAQPSRTPTLFLSLTSSSNHNSSSHQGRELEQLQLENACLKAQNAGLREEATSLKAQHNAAQAHAVFAGQQFSVYKQQLHRKTKKEEGSKRVSTSAQVLTSWQARLEIAADAAKKAEKARELQEKQQRDAQKAREDIICCAEQERQQTEFSGNMKYMSQSTLVDIAFSFNIETEKVTADNLCSHLNDHFEANPELKKHPWYVSLFEQSQAQKRKDPPNKNNGNGTSSRRPSPSPTSHPSSLQPNLFPGYTPASFGLTMHSSYPQHLPPFYPNVQLAAYPPMPPHHYPLTSCIPLSPSLRIHILSMNLCR